jgi:hypothetical protein
MLKKGILMKISAERKFSYHKAKERRSERTIVLGGRNSGSYLQIIFIAYTRPFNHLRLVELILFDVTILHGAFFGGTEKAGLRRSAPVRAGLRRSAPVCAGPFSKILYYENFVLQNKVRGNYVQSSIKGEPRTQRRFIERKLNYTPTPHSEHDSLTSASSNSVIISDDRANWLFIDLIVGIRSSGKPCASL